LGPAGQGIGLGFRYEKVFLSTQREVELEGGGTESELMNTQHSHLLFRLLYAYRFGPQSSSAPEINLQLGVGFLSFLTDDNDEYKGADYRYFSEGLEAYIPLGSPFFALDIGLALLQADLGESVEELGGAASTSGYRLYFGFGSELGGGLSLRGGVDYKSLSSEVSGRGRQYGASANELASEHGRTGTEAEDSYLSICIMGGYLF